MGEDEFPTFHSGVKRGDIVGIIGFPGSRLFGLFVVTIFMNSICVYQFFLSLLLIKSKDYHFWVSENALNKISLALYVCTYLQWDL